MTLTTTNSKGQMLIELALLLPFLTIFVFGVFDFSRWMYLKNTMNNAARAGARAAAVMTAPPPTAVLAKPVSAASNDLERAVVNNLFNGVPPDSVTYDVEIIYTGGRSAGPVQSGDFVHVTVNWSTFQMFFPTIRALFSPPLSGDATMRYE